MANGKMLKIYNENCLNTLLVVGDEIINLTVTFPPHDDYTALGLKFEEIVRELYRITKPGGFVIYIVKDSIVNGSKTGNAFRQALFFQSVGFNLHDTMVWEKLGDESNSPLHYLQSVGFMFVFSKLRKEKVISNKKTEKEKNRTINLIRDRKNSVVGETNTAGARGPDGENSVKRKIDSKEFGIRFNTWEMSQKAIVDGHILTWSNEGDVVLDPFMSKSNTVVADCCRLRNRKFIGVVYEENR